MLSAFQLRYQGKTFDYGSSTTNPALHDVSKWVAKKGYQLSKILGHGRHTTALLHHGVTPFFAKIAHSPGTGLLLSQEYRWLSAFHAKQARSFRVPTPIVFDESLDGYSILITEFIQAPPLHALPDPGVLDPDWKISKSTMRSLLSVADEIAVFPHVLPCIDESLALLSPQEAFVQKVSRHFQALPAEIASNPVILRLFQKVHQGASSLSSAGRHGDYTPWHILQEGASIFLLDAEHAHSHSVELYDLAYFVQRMHSVIGAEEGAVQFIQEISKQRNRPLQLQTVLAARAIGGFLDESLVSNPSYSIHFRFAKRIEQLV